MAADEEMCRAAWDTAEDLELTEDCHVEWLMLPTRQRGVWHFYAGAKSVRENEVGRLLGSITGTFPNGVAGTLSAFVFGKMNSLSQMVTNMRASEYQEKLGRGLPRSKP
jgi:hypothetical protein